jgi:putative ABC transport system permease protein
MSIRLVAGRDIERLDGPDAEPVALVNETFVRTQLEGRDPIDLVVRHAGEGDERSIRIVGVVGDVVQTSADEGPRPAVYMPYTQAHWPWVQAVVRTDLPPETILPELRKAVARFNPVVPPTDVRTMTDRMATTRVTPRFQTMLIGAFALVALLLAATGLYGSLAHSVGRRERELGVRMALGAERIGVLRMVLGQGMKVALPGLVIGMVGTFWSTRVLSGVLYGVEPNDPLTLSGVALILFAVSVAACVLPARRATTVDPVRVLKSE